MASTALTGLFLTKAWCV